MPPLILRPYEPIREADCLEVARLEGRPYFTLVLKYDGPLGQSTTAEIDFDKERGNVRVMSLAMNPGLKGTSIDVVVRRTIDLRVALRDRRVLDYFRAE